jgi:hypothetical protein
VSATCPQCLLPVPACCACGWTMLPIPSNRIALAKRDACHACGAVLPVYGYGLHGFLLCYKCEKRCAKSALKAEAAACEAEVAAIQQERPAAAGGEE